MRKCVIGLLFVLLSITAMSWAYMESMRGTVREDVVLRNSVIETVQRSSEVDFAELASFQWDTLYVFTPYSVPKEELGADGVSVGNQQFSIEHSDSMNMIGFVSSGRMVTFIELPMASAGVELTGSGKFSRDESAFTVSRDKAIVFASEH